MGQLAMNWGKAPTTILSFGGGQDSTALLLLALFDADFRKKYVPGKLLVIMADTGDEHQHTYEHVETIRELCKDVDWVDFHLVDHTMGFHPNTWPTLRSQMERNNTIMGTGFSKSCTSNLKIVPIYNFAEQWLAKEYSYKPVRKVPFYRYNAEFGKMRVIIGIAAGEENRLGKSMPEIWMRHCLERVYPLVDMGYDRLKCQKLIASYGFKVPPPSNCILCPFMSKQELLWLFRFQEQDYHYWVQREKAKMAKPVAPGRNNLGVFGKNTLDVMLQQAIKEYGHWTDEQLNEYKFSHGHCVQSKF